MWLCMKIVFYFVGTFLPKYRKKETPVFICVCKTAPAGTADALFIQEFKRFYVIF
jgi:hypothetical protein